MGLYKLLIFLGKNAVIDESEAEGNDQGMYTGIAAHQKMGIDKFNVEPLFCFSR